MAANPFFSGRIPQSLLDAVEEHRRSTGETKTDVLFNALSRYVNYQPATTNSPVSSSNWLEEKFNALEQKMEALDDLSEEVASLKRQIAAIVAASRIDNVPDIQPDNAESNKGQLSLLESDIGIDNTSDNGSVEQNAIDKTLPETEEVELEVSEPPTIGKRELTIEEILELPELQHLDHQKLKRRLLNARYQDRLPISAGPLMVGDAGKKGRQLLWEIWQGDNT